MRKTVVIFTVLLLSFTAIALIGCGGDEEIVDKGPSIIGAYPKTGADDMPTTAAIMVTFDEEISPPSAANLTFTPSVSGTVTYDAGSYTLIYKPSTDLIVNTKYSLKISGVTDIAGNPMTPVTTEFTTTGPDTGRPEVIRTSPETGSKDIGHDEEFTFRFSEPIDRAKFRSAIYFTPEIDVEQSDWVIEWGFGDEEDVTISPPPETYPYPLNKSCTLLLAKGAVTDTSGNPLLIDYKLEFKTLRYAIVTVKNPFFHSKKQTPIWVYRIGEWNGKWIVLWGGARPPGGPSGTTPSGTITASADGYILDNFELDRAEIQNVLTCSVSKGNGNRLTYTSGDIATEKWYLIIFASTSKYLTFDLRTSAGTIKPPYVWIGHPMEAENPTTTPFAILNKNR
jgi:hypothetical protein